MIKRTTKKYIKQLLKSNPDWDVLDIGCGGLAWEEAQTLLDIKDHDELYPQKRFVQCDASDTPFKDKEFDFVIASHITEHMAELEKFLNGLSRVSKRGYIEVPVPLFDNLTYGNDAHCWWVNFDDIEQQITFTPKIQMLLERIWPYELPPLEVYFRSSMVLELYWEDNIEWRMENAPCRMSNNRDIWPVPHSKELKKPSNIIPMTITQRK